MTHFIIGVVLLIVALTCLAVEAALMWSAGAFDVPLPPVQPSRVVIVESAPPPALSPEPLPEPCIYQDDLRREHHLTSASFGVGRLETCPSTLRRVYADGVVAPAGGLWP